jgi:hypothetical protein
MEALAAVFKELYTSFLLRDFAGKIVPGCFLLLSYSALFVHPGEIIKSITGKISLVSVFLIAGFAWTIVLGLQSLAELVRIWNYYPSAAGAEMTVQAQVARFLQLACPEDRQQYERYVVIKEATGNLFVAGILSAPAWIWWLNAQLGSVEAKKAIWGNARINLRTMIVFFLAVIIWAGLFRMNGEHVKKQYEFAIDWLKDFDKGSLRGCASGRDASPAAKPAGMNVTGDSGPASKPSK